MLCGTLLESEDDIDTSHPIKYVHSHLGNWTQNSKYSKKKITQLQLNHEIRSGGNINMTVKIKLFKCIERWMTF